MLVKICDRTPGYASGETLSGGTIVKRLTTKGGRGHGLVGFAPVCVWVFLPGVGSSGFLLGGVSLETEWDVRALSRCPALITVVVSDMTAVTTCQSNERSVLFSAVVMRDN